MPGDGHAEPSHKGPGKLKQIDRRLSLDQPAPELLTVLEELRITILAQISLDEGVENDLASLTNHLAIEPLIHALMLLGVHRGFGRGLNFSIELETSQLGESLLHYKDGLALLDCAAPLGRPEMLACISPGLHGGLKLAHGGNL